MAELRFEQIKPKIGARVLNSKEELLSGELTNDVLKLLEDSGVLVFPEIHFTDAEQVAFTNVLGGNTKEIRGEEVFKVTLDEKINDKVAEYLKGSLYWHIDGTMHSVPIRASMLTAKVLSPEGGDTDFANTATSYADLSEEKKAEIADLRGAHNCTIRPNLPLPSWRIGSRMVRPNCRWSARTNRGASRSFWATPRIM